MSFSLNAYFSHQTKSNVFFTMTHAMSNIMYLIIV